MQRMVLVMVLGLVVQLATAEEKIPVGQGCDPRIGATACVDGAICALRSVWECQSTTTTSTAPEITTTTLGGGGQ